jgi:porin
VLGAGRAGLNPTAIGSWPSRHEAMVELGYQLQLNANLNLQPTLQWILNPSAAPQPVPSILAAILQLSLTF